MRSEVQAGQEFGVVKKKKKSGKEESKFYLTATKDQEEEEKEGQCLPENSEHYLVCRARAREVV